MTAFLFDLKLHYFTKDEVVLNETFNFYCQKHLPTIRKRPFLLEGTKLYPIINRKPYTLY